MDKLKEKCIKINESSNEIKILKSKFDYSFSRSVLIHKLKDFAVDKITESIFIDASNALKLEVTDLLNELDSKLYKLTDVAEIISGIQSLKCMKSTNDGLHIFIDDYNKFTNLSSFLNIDLVSKFSKVLNPYVDKYKDRIMILIKERESLIDELLSSEVITKTINVGIVESFCNTYGFTKTQFGFLYDNHGAKILINDSSDGFELKISFKNRKTICITNVNHKFVFEGLIFLITEHYSTPDQLKMICKYVNNPLSKYIESKL